MTTNTSNDTRIPDWKYSSCRFYNGLGNCINPEARRGKISVPCYAMKQNIGPSNCRHVTGKESKLVV